MFGCPSAIRFGAYDDLSRPATIYLADKPLLGDRNGREPRPVDGFSLPVYAAGQTKTRARRNRRHGMRCARGVGQG